MLSDLIASPPELRATRISIERLRTHKGMFDVIFDASMIVCDRYGIIGPVGEANCQPPAK
jgi:hypothetical protein